jgi:hypothetical protein
LCRVEHETVETDHGRLGVIAATHQRPQPRAAFFKSKRFDEIVICAQVQSLETVFKPILGRENQNMRIISLSS